MFCHVPVSGKANYSLRFNYQLVVLMTVAWKTIYPLLLQLANSFQEPSCWPLSPVSLELLVHLSLPTKLFRYQNKEPICLEVPVIVG